MKSAPFTYHDPTSVPELVDLLANAEDAKILAGGQSLMPMMNMRFLMPDDVIDINGVHELNFIERENGHLKFGAMTRQKEVLGSSTVANAAPIFGEALRYVGHIQTRTRGTIGGSLCHLDPSAELPAIASLYGAEMKIANADGERTVSMHDWALAYMTPNISPEDVLVDITFPLWGQNHGYAFEEFARRHGDFAITAVGTLLELDQNQIITKAAIVVAGADVTPTRLYDVEKDLIGQIANEGTFADAANHAGEIEAMTDAYVTATYRQRLAKTLTKRALISATERAKEKQND